MIFPVHQSYFLLIRQWHYLATRRNGSFVITVIYSNASGQAQLHPFQSDERYVNTLFMLLAVINTEFLDVNRSKFYSGRNLEQIEVRECLLLFGAESFVLQVAIQKLKD